MKTLYTTSATAVGGRAGHARSDDGALDVPLTVPKQLGGDGKPGTNPEQMFAAGYAACFESALRHIANERKLPVEASEVTATVGIGPRDAGGFGLQVALRVTLKGVPRDAAQAMVDTAHSVVCPYSNAVRGNVDVEVTLA